MARSTSRGNTTKPAPALLAKPREEVRVHLLGRVEGGEEMVTRDVEQTSAFLGLLRADFDRWDDYNSELLRRVFTSDQYADEYSWFPGSVVASMRAPSFFDRVEELKKRVLDRRNRLTSIIERLDLIDEANGISPAAPAELVSADARPAISSENKKVFLVHGQDEEAKAVVARFITMCGLQPIILHEQPNGGATVIEKFEKEADVGFAIVLMTPDDVGGLRMAGELASDHLQPRARQNVVLELGYFAGRLGRKRVAALKKGDLEMPSDVAGVVWTPMDASDGWKASLARELTNAGYDIDTKRAFGF